MPVASRPFLIGVAGGTCAGKTMVCERLAAKAGEDLLALIRLDSYQVDHSHQSVAERAATNYDHPDAYDWDLLNDHLARLVAGERVLAPTYDFAVHNRSDVVRPIDPTPVIVVEGILVLHDPTLAKLRLEGLCRCRCRSSLHPPLDARRGRTRRSPDSIIEQYLTTVRPGHEQYIEPSKRYANVIISGGGKNGRRSSYFSPTFAS